MGYWAWVMLMQWRVEQGYAQVVAFRADGASPVGSSRREQVNN